MKKVITIKTDIDIQQVAQEVTPKLEKILDEAEASIQSGEVSPERNNIDDFMHDLES